MATSSNAAITLLFFFSFSAVVALPPDSDLLKVPRYLFMKSIKSTVEEVEKVASFLSDMEVQQGFPLSYAMEACQDLLHFTMEELRWTLSAMENPGNYIGTGDPGSDMTAWLTGTMGNQETCLEVEGFEGGLFHNLVSGRLEKITLLIGDILSMLHPFPFDMPGRKKFPSWIKRSEKSLLQTPVKGLSVDFVVAADGTGNSTRVMDAVLSAPEQSSKRYIIYVKRGIYMEYVDLKENKMNVMIVGDGMDVTVISGNRSYVDRWKTYNSATFAIEGIGFIARDITFENTAGPSKEQAVALRSNANLSVFFRCSFRGYQDTLYATLCGNFIGNAPSHVQSTLFGDDTVVFQKCHILARKPLPGQKNTITAQGRKAENKTTGFVIQSSKISGDSDLVASPNTTSTYIGQPWQLYWRTVVMESYLSSLISP